MNAVTRFRFLIGALIISVVAQLAWGAETRVVILHTSDLHGHITAWRGWAGDLAGKTVGGFDRLAAAVEDVRRNRENVLLLDAGDTVADTMIGMKTQGRAIGHPEITAPPPGRIQRQVER